MIPVHLHTFNDDIPDTVPYIWEGMKEKSLWKDIYVYLEAVYVLEKGQSKLTL